MKKLSIAMLSMLLAGSMLLTGCGGNTQSDASTTDDAAQTEQSADGGVLRMGTNATFPPYEYVDENNNVAGIDADIAAAIAEKLGMQLEITDMAFDSLIPALQSDTIDIVLAGMTVDPERAESVNFTESYATGVQVIIVPEGSDIASRMIWMARTSAYRPAPLATCTALTPMVRSMSSSLTMARLLLRRC